MESSENRFADLEIRLLEVKAQLAESVKASQALAKRLTRLQDNHKKLYDRLIKLESDHQMHSNSQRTRLDMREQCFLAFMRDRCAGQKEVCEGTSGKLGQSGPHGGDALADASMFLERRPPGERRAFELLYGLSAETIQELGGFGTTLRTRMI